MSSPHLRLYVDSQFVSPYAMSVFVAMQEKNLSFEIETINLAAHQNEESQFISTSITRRIPTLICDDFSLSESSAIAEYLDEVFTGQRLYPILPQDRAKARQVQAWLRSDLLALRNERPTEVIFERPITSQLSPEARKAADKLIEAAELLLPSESNYLCGEWCIADVDLALMLNRLAFNGDEIPERLAAYARYQWQRPSVQSWLKQRLP